MLNIKNICHGCDHFCLNNEDGLTEGCRAFPDGIPYEYGAGVKHFHDKPLEDQVEDYVYIPVKRKDVLYMPVKEDQGVEWHDGMFLIWQHSNPYADENGRYKED